MDLSAKIHVCGIIDGTSVDGPGLRTSIYFAGCRHHCAGCHNPETWDFNAGEEYSLQQLLHRIVDNELDVTFTGGDPIYHASTLLPLAKAIKEHRLNLWLFTGFTYEDLQNATDNVKQLLEYVDVLVDGPFVQSLRDTSLIFRGSSNQRLIDLNASRRCGLTLYEPNVGINL